ncbi:hypothetical protein N7532_003072 [Penicillium argentinense]|uniref:Uncharacterized protein n=1 Tax=Penicillium argentinense TaxID=1131581 RepID=A0A9W9FLV5_9EURO|nr:uncharacterized protein N7532_003072 [Penicillium argentinense]KAJ5102543.1 hypothetical protein N7532_003072 [Penicillium argentinense]
MAKNFDFGLSDPHPGIPGEIYFGEDWVPSSPVPDVGFGRAMIDISDLPSVEDLSRNRIRLPEVFAAWREKLARPFKSKKNKGKESEKSSDKSRSRERSSLNMSLSSLSSLGNTLKKNVIFPFRR